MFATYHTTIMDNILFKTLYDTGLYSDFELTINSKKYKLHKHFASASKFIKTLIDYIGVMSTDDDITIYYYDGKLIDTQYVDEIIKWFYHQNMDLVELLSNPKKIDNIKCILKYYCVADFLQIDEIKEKLCGIINNVLGSYTDSKSFSNISYLETDKFVVARAGYCDSTIVTIDTRRRTDRETFARRIYDDLLKVKDYIPRINIKTFMDKKYGKYVSNLNYIYSCIFGDPSTDIIDTICTVHYYMDEGRSEFVEFLAINRSPENIRVAVALHKYFTNHSQQLPSINNKLSLDDVNKFVDIVRKNNYNGLIDLLDIHEYYIINSVGKSNYSPKTNPIGNQTDSSNDILVDLNFDKMKQLQDFCGKYGMDGCYSRKLATITQFFVYDE